MPNPLIAITRCTDYSQPKISEAVARQFELLGGLEKFVKSGDTVLLKPNFITPRARRCATQTDPAVILETARLLKDFGAKPFVGDSPAWGNVFTCVKKLELAQPLKELGVPVKQLDKPLRTRISQNNTNVRISSVALDADVIINLPKFKSHQQLVATFAVKNMFGCVAGKQKAYWHFANGKSRTDFCGLLIEIYKFTNPALTIIDAVIAMDGPGPINGRPRPLGWLIGGVDPIACEALCCELIDIDPADLPIIKTAARMNYGCSDLNRIEIKGDDFSQNICTDFQPAEIIPIGFSFLHVCRSIAKQAVLLARSAISKPNRK